MSDGNDGGNILQCGRLEYNQQFVSNFAAYIIPGNMISPAKAADVNKISLTDKFAQIHDYWRPRVAAELNGQELKLVKFCGVFPWHHHEHVDELFLVWRGAMCVEYRDKMVELGPGELCVVPRGVEHRTIANEEAEVLVFEPAATRNTGNVVDSEFTAPNGVVI